MLKRKRVVGLLRRMHLLSIAEECRYLFHRLRAAPANRRFQRRNPSFRPPPPRILFDVANTLSWQRYRDLGRTHARVIADLIREHVPDDPLEVLEWGCGLGRLIQNMPGSFGDRTVRLTGSDANPESIAWCERNLVGPTFVVNRFEPPLPFEESRFHAVYGFSVLTHLSEPLQMRWVEELRRVLRPGGVLVLTTHGDRYENHLEPAELSAYRRGELVVLDRFEEGKKHFLAYHPPTWVRRTLLRGFDVLAHLPAPAEHDTWQDFWVARRRESR